MVNRILAKPQQHFNLNPIEQIIDQVNRFVNKQNQNVFGLVESILAIRQAYKKIVQI